MSVENHSSQDDIDEMDISESPILSWAEEAVQRQGCFTNSTWGEGTARANGTSKDLKSPSAVPRSKSQKESSKDRTKAMNRESAKRSREKQKKKMQDLKIRNENLLQENKKLNKEVNFLNTSDKILRSWLHVLQNYCNHGKEIVPNTALTDRYLESSCILLGDTTPPHDGIPTKTEQNGVLDNTIGPTTASLGDQTNQLNDFSLCLSDDPMLENDIDLGKYLDILDDSSVTIYPQTKDASLGTKTESSFVSRGPNLLDEAFQSDDGLFCSCESFLDEERHTNFPDCTTQMQNGTYYAEAEAYSSEKMFQIDNQMPQNMERNPGRGLKQKRDNEETDLSMAGRSKSSGCMSDTVGTSSNISLLLGHSNGDSCQGLSSFGLKKVRSNAIEETSRVTSPFSIPVQPDGQTSHQNVWAVCDQDGCLEKEARELMKGFCQ